MASTASTLLQSLSHTVKESDGYNVNVFKGKQEQTVKVVEFLESKGFIPKELVQNEVSWFYG